MMDKYEVAKTIGEEFNYPWIEEMNCFDGFPEVLKNEDGTDIEGSVLEYASDSLKADREVVIEAIRNESYSIIYASEELQNDPELKKLADD